MINSLKKIKEKALKSINKDYVSKEDIDYLLEETFSLKSYELLLRKNDEFEDSEFFSRFERINNGEPLYYVLGKAPFYGREFIVKEGITLIPRNETEELISLALKIIDNKNMVLPSILDIGSGTGCIAITLSKELKCDVVSCDISKECLQVAKENNKLNDASVTFIESDVFSNIDGKFDIIISNPPYIDRDTFVQESVIKYEPHLALFASNHGLKIYEEIFKNIDSFLNEFGVSLYEISPDLMKGLQELIKKYLPTYSYEFVEDMNHFVRFLILYK